MELFYNNEPLHAVGILGELSQRTAPEPEPAKASRRRVTLSGTLTFRERSWASNRALVEQVQAIFATTSARLLWQDENSSTKYADREVFVGDVQWPDTGKGGTRHQKLTFEFHWYEETEDASIAATWQPTGSATVTTLSRVESVRESLGIERAHGLRPDRVGAGGSVSLRGKYLPELDDALDDRMTVLNATRETWITAFNVRDGTLIFGGASFNRVVKVKAFQCEIAQDGMALDWSLDAEYSRFPDESNYFLCRYEIKEQDQREQGQKRVTLSGQIGAQTLTAAQAKLASLRALLGGRYSGKTLVLDGPAESTSREFAGVEDAPVGVIGVTDAPAFHELTFTETYKVTSGTVADWSLRMADEETPSQGFVRRTFSGSVGAKGATYDAAYQACVTKAKALAADKHVMMLSGVIRASDNQQSADYQGAGTDRFCRVEFEYAYQLKSASRTWIEIESEARLETFSVSRETVSGSVMATDAATARTAYAIIRAGYSTLLVENETVREKRVNVGRGSIAAGATNPSPLTPPNSGAGWGTSINTTEVTADTAESTSPEPQIVNPPVTGSTYARQWTGLTFSFVVVRPKTSSQVAVKYAQQTTADYESLLTHTSLSGQVQADSLATANAVITALLPGGIQPKRREVTEDLGQFWGASPYSSKVPSAAPAVYGYSFNVTWEAALTSYSGLVEANVTEELEHSGANWVTHRTAFGRPVVQQCGYTPAGRTVRAEATCAVEATAITWCKRAWRLAYGGWVDNAPAGNPGSTSDGSDRWVRKNGSTITGYLNPPKFSGRAVFPKFTTTPSARGTPNANLFTISMSASEIVPSMDAATHTWT